MAITPTVGSQARAEIIIDAGTPGVDTGDIGNNCTRLEWKGMMNGGYMIRFRLSDAGFNILKKYLVEIDYYKFARSTALRVSVRLSWSDATVPNRTDWQIAYITSMGCEGRAVDVGYITFTAIDPPSWFLNCGDASGKVYSGKISDAIKQCVADYAPGVTLEVTETTDSVHNRWWMMRQDPKTFISSLLDWSSPLTPKKTKWIVSSDGMNLSIKEQADIQSRAVAFYRGTRPNNPHIQNWELLDDDSLAILGSKLVTSGLSAISGRYTDKITDTLQTKVFAKDATTRNKYKARTTADRAFTKPADAGPPRAGWTAVPSIPEIYSAGEIGHQYEDYIDGRARTMLLNMENLVNRVRFSVLGHGIYSSSYGLGTDTIAIEWRDVDGASFFLAGNWIIYGFWHVYTTSSWLTNIFCARLDWDAAAVPVPALPAG